jgi:hypothetical protein
MATRKRRERPTPEQAKKYGPRGGKQFEVVSNSPAPVKATGGNGGGFKFPSPSGGSSAGTKIFLLVAAVLTLYLVFSGHLQPVLNAAAGNTHPAAKKPGGKVKSPKSIKVKVNG